MAAKRNCQSRFGAKQRSQPASHQLADTFLPGPTRKAVRQDMETWPVIRSQRVARARELARDPDYPPPSVIDSVARILAKEFKEPPGLDVG